MRTNALAVIRSISVQLKNRANDQYIGYQMIRETADVLKHLRQHADVEFGQWFAKSADVSGATRVSRIAAGQKHRNNVPHESTEEYYRRSVFILFIDHLIKEVDTRLDTFFFIHRLIIGKVPHKTVQSQIHSAESVMIKEYNWTI